MANENWDLLGDKLRSYRPAVDADGAWRAARAQLAATPPHRRLTWWQLLGWKAGEMLVLLLCLWAWDGSTSTEIPRQQVAVKTPTRADRPVPALAAPLGKEKHSDTSAAGTAGVAKRVLTPVADRGVGAKGTVPATRTLPGASVPRRLLAAPPTVTAPSALTSGVAYTEFGKTGKKAANHTNFREFDSPQSPLVSLVPRNYERISAREAKANSVYSTSAVAPSLRFGAVAPLPVAELGALRAVAANWPEWRPVAPAQNPVSTAFSWALTGGLGQTPGGHLAPVVGAQLRLPLGPRQAVAFGAAYQRVRGMGLHWHQAEYHKDFGYPTGNSVERWLDSYGAWEYSIDYHQRLSGRLAWQTGVQLTILQERGLRERIQGSEFFLGSRRRSLIDRDFGLRIGLDYRLTRQVALYVQYLQGLGDISPDYLYQDEKLHRHGGLRVGLRLMPFE
jgi:hypothetical protein